MSKAVIVCSNNAILFGWTDDIHGESITLTRARQAYYWVNEGGHMGLARTGPQPGSRVGAEGTITVRSIACVIDASEAADAWAAYPVTTA
jgi:hypothetical protein